jgi:hypothetical protein
MKITPKSIAKKLRNVSYEMNQVANEMATLPGEFQNHARELKGAAIIADTWGLAILEECGEAKPKRSYFTCDPGYVKWRDQQIHRMTAITDRPSPPPNAPSPRPKAPK